MIRQHKKMILLTSIVTLLPILIGLLLWNRLPDTVATHFGTDNQPNGIQLQSLCSVWTSSNAVVLSSPVYSFHKYGSQSKRYQQKNIPGCLMDLSADFFVCLQHHLYVQCRISTECPVSLCHTCWHFVSYFRQFYSENKAEL